MQTLSALPRYKSHKVVRAVKIENILLMPSGGASIVPSDPGIEHIHVKERYLEKHAPQIGGYFVVYEDGYQSWSPAEAFENGYTKIETVDSTSDERTVNNVMRHKYRVLDDAEKANMQIIKDEGLQFWSQIDLIATTQKNADPRSLALAKTKIQEAVMWAVHGLTD